MISAHTDVEIAKRRDKQACLAVFPSPHPFIAGAIPAPSGAYERASEPHCAFEWPITLCHKASPRDPCFARDFKQERRGKRENNEMFEESKKEEDRRQKSAYRMKA
jgi:hypothetical protein